MYHLLEGLRVAEMASFVAGPSCGLHLLQLGAEVIRIDPIRGGLDKNRWPLAPDGASLYWQGLNKGKKSVALDLGCDEGRELATAIITAPGSAAGLFITNQAPRGAFAHNALSKRRVDLISLRVLGWGNGATAVDYTVNAAFGLPYMTGPAETEGEPVNHVLPAWDLICGAYSAFALLAAERRRRETGRGGEVHVPLSDIAASTLGHLGQVAEVTLGQDRPKMGNDLFGTFGRDFMTRDGVRVMVIAITSRQWSSLVDALKLETTIVDLEFALGTKFGSDEGARFLHRDALNSVVAGAIGTQDYATLAEEFDRRGVCYRRYRTLKEAVDSEECFQSGYGVFEPVEHPGGHRYPTPGAPARISEQMRTRPPVAPRLGEHTEMVLSEVLKLGAADIGRLVDAGIMARPY
jgi:2-methylfumaryl-CoA isomerase